MHLTLIQDLTPTWSRFEISNDETFPYQLNLIEEH